VNFCVVLDFFSLDVDQINWAARLETRDQMFDKRRFSRAGPAREGGEKFLVFVETRRGVGGSFEEGKKKNGFFFTFR